MIYTHNQQQQQIIHAIAQLMNEFHMDFDSFCKALREQYVYHVYQQYQGITRTALKSGIDRRIVSSILKGEKGYSKRPLLLCIIDAIKQKASEKDMMLPKNGINSMASIIEDVAYGSTTSKTVLDVLKDTGIIEDHGKKFKFLGYPPKGIDQKVLESFTQDFCQLVNDFTNEVSNKNTTDNNVNTDL